MVSIKVTSNLAEVKRKNLIYAPTTYKFREKLSGKVNTAFNLLGKSIEKEVIKSMHQPKHGVKYFQGWYKDKSGKFRKFEHQASKAGEGLASYSGRSEKQLQYKVLPNTFRMTFGSKAPAFVYWENAPEKIRRPTIIMAIRRKHTDFLRFFKRSFKV